jgi:hypothetical protein
MTRAAAIIAFRPAAFFVQGDKQTAAELARLKGEMDAIEQASIRKQCGVQFQHAPPPAPPPQADRRLGVGLVFCVGTA